MYKRPSGIPLPSRKWGRRANALSACDPQMAAADTESALQGYAQAGQTEWIENEIKWGTDYLLKTIKNNQENVTLVYQARLWAWPQHLCIRPRKLVC